MWTTEKYLDLQYENYSYIVNVVDYLKQLPNKA